MGTSSAFYTFLSRRTRGAKFFTAYFAWISLQFVCPVILIGIVLPQSINDRMWFGLDRWLLIQAMAASFVTGQIWNMITQMGEAVRQTILIQAASILQASAHLALIGLAFSFGWLNLESVLWLLIGEYLLLAILLGPKLLKANTKNLSQTDDLRGIWREFVSYCAPLVLYGIVGFGYTFADRWILQKFGGAAQQGMFSVGQQFANIGLIATSSVLKVFWKEIAEARERGDTNRVERLFTNVSLLAYLFGVWLSCLLIPYTREIISLFLGDEFRDAWLTMALLLIFPIHQALGQVGGSFFYASGLTGGYVKLGLTMMLVGIPITYFVLADSSAVVPGLGLGSEGLAAKLVILQIIGINLLNYLTPIRSQAFQFWYQARLFFTLLGISLIGKLIVSFTAEVASVSSIAIMPLGWLFYCVVSAVILLKIPGLSRVDTKSLANGLVSIFLAIRNRLTLRG